MGMTLQDLVNAINSRNGFDKSASQKVAEGEMGAMPPAETVHKAPLNQPAGEAHELEATMGAGAEDRRAILKDQLMSAAGSEKAEESRMDPDEVHNVSQQSKAQELMPPVGNVDMAMYEGPQTPESKISTDADIVNTLLDRVRGTEEEATKSAEEEESDRLLKIAEEYYHAGQIFAQGFLDKVAESESKEASEVDETPEAPETETDKFASMQEQINNIVEFLTPIAEALNEE